MLRLPSDRFQCDTHEDDADICSACGGRYGALVDYWCTNCTHIERNFPVGLHLLITSPDLLAFVGCRGTTPTNPTWSAQAEISAFTEVITGVEPFEARYRYSLAGDEIEVLVDEDLTVTHVERSSKR